MDTKSIALREIDSIIAEWWDCCTQPQRTDAEEAAVRRRLVDCGARLGAKIQDSKTEFLALGPSKDAIGLVVDLRSIVREVATMVRYSGSFPQLPEFERMVGILLVSSLDVTLGVCFGDDWAFRNECVSAVSLLSRRGQHSEAAELVVLALDCVGNWKSCREVFRERFLLAVLSSQLFWSVREILPVLDPDIKSNWKYEQREYGTPFNEAIEAENFTLSPRFVSFYRDGATYCSIESQVPPRRVDVDMRVYAATWCDDKTLWVVFDGWAPIFLDGQRWSFAPDKRCFSSVECTPQPMKNLPDWIKGQSLQRKRRN